MAHQHTKLPACANCHHAFLPNEPDEFCPRCGQQNHEVNIGFGHVVEEFLEGVFHFDGKVFRTAGLLLFRPGQLTLRFLQGHRVPYVPPIRLYVFISFVFFALLSLLKGHSEDDKRRLVDFTSGQKEQAYVYRNTPESRRANQERDSALTTLAQELKAELADTSAASRKKRKANFNLTGMDFPLEEVRRLPQNLSDPALDSVIRSKGRQPGLFNRRAVRAMLRWRDVTREEAMHQVLRGASILLFLLMPLAALLLKAAYFRRRLHYISHLIFTVHIHCFLFVFIGLLLLLERLHLHGALNGVLSLVLPVYFVVALHTFYQQGWGKTLLKALLLSLAYGVTIAVASLVVGVGGLLYF